mmetsp:Transcript_39882/g.114902  ORF Transcript_39882/g.114902 Transcript_39882/m.114902 type:complete len:224 (-) Transcript_39882:414-1085(-)
MDPLVKPSRFAWQIVLRPHILPLRLRLDLLPAVDGGDPIFEPPVVQQGVPLRRKVEHGARLSVAEAKPAGAERGLEALAGAGDAEGRRAREHAEEARGVAADVVLSKDQAVRVVCDVLPALALRDLGQWMHVLHDRVLHAESPQPLRQELLETAVQPPLAPRDPHAPGHQVRVLVGKRLDEVCQVSVEERVVLDEPDEVHVLLRQIRCTLLPPQELIDSGQNV